LFIAALAVWHVVEVWHHSSLFAGWRAWFEVQDNLLARMVLCPFCLSMWVAFLATPFAMPKIEPAKPFGGDALAWVWYATQSAGFMLLVAFAIARLANLGNDLSHSYCRTPKETGVPADPNSGIEKRDEQPATDRRTLGTGQPDVVPFEPRSTGGPPADV
jgi:hypothetical protein